MKKKEYFSKRFAAATINEYAKLTFLQSNESVPIGLFGSTENCYGEIGAIPHIVFTFDQL